MNTGQLTAIGVVAGACVLVPVTTIPELLATRNDGWRGLGREEWQAIDSYVFRQYLWFATVVAVLLLVYGGLV